MVKQRVILGTAFVGSWFGRQVGGGSESGRGWGRGRVRLGSFRGVIFHDAAIDLGGWLGHIIALGTRGFSVAFRVCVFFVALSILSFLASSFVVI